MQLDCLCIRDANKQNHWFLSILDRATSYHVLELLRDHSPKELHRAFDRGWCKWAGVPMRVTTDLEGGFVGPDFWTQVSQAGTSLVSIAGTAHFQAGKIERQLPWFSAGNLECSEKFTTKEIQLRIIFLSEKLVVTLP